MIGEVLGGRYQIGNEIGCGAIGTVYEAFDQVSGKNVAIKVLSSQLLKSSPDLTRRFAVEPQATSAVASRHIVQVVDSGTDSATKRPYIVMDRMRGEDLASLAKRTGPLVADLAIRILAQTCLGLAKAHGAGVVHRDIKPANLYLCHGGQRDVVVKILDFGVAKVTNDPTRLGLTQTGTMIGSPHYMSPEQARGERDLDARADLWSLGVVAYRMLAGRLPFEHVRGLCNLLMAICCENIRPLRSVAPWVRPEVAAIVHRALASERVQRFSSALDMRAALLRVCHDDTIALSSLPPVGRDDEVDTLPWLPSTRPPPQHDSCHLDDRNQL